MTTVLKQHPLTLSAGVFVLEVDGDPNGFVYAAGCLAIDRTAAAPHAGLWQSFGGGTWKRVAVWLDDLADVSTSGEAAGDFLVYNGTEWVPATLTVSGGSITITYPTGGGGGGGSGGVSFDVVTSVSATAPIHATSTGTTPGTGDVTLSHDASGVTAGTYGDATHVAQVTVNATGHVISASSVALALDPADDTKVWMPLTTVVAGVPELVWDADDSLIPTLIPI